MRRALGTAVALVGLVACEPPASEAPEPSPVPAAPAPSGPITAEPAAEPDPAAFDAPLPPGTVAIEVCSLDAILGVESDGPAIGPIAWRGDGVVLLAMDEQLAELTPVAARDCRFTARVTPRPGLVGARAELHADRADPAAAWLADGPTLVELGGASAAIDAGPIDAGPIAPHPEGGVWARVEGRVRWIGAPDGRIASRVAAGLVPRAVFVDGTLAFEDGGALVRIAPDGARTPLGPAAPLVRAGDDGLVLAAPRASGELRVLDLDGALRRTLAPAETVDLALGVMNTVAVTSTLTGLSEVRGGTGYVALETSRDGVRLAVIARVRGL
jgi:hypothetical protein